MLLNGNVSFVKKASLEFRNIRSEFLPEKIGETDEEIKINNDATDILITLQMLSCFC